MAKALRIERKLKTRVRVWLEMEGQPVFGDGRALLLEAISAEGSIKRGAEALGMSYRHAWGHINHIERRLGVKVIERRSGGPRGGGSRLTAEAERLLAVYREFRKTVQPEVAKAWRAAVKRKPQDVRRTRKRV